MIKSALLVALLASCAADWTDWPTKYRVYSHASGWGPWYSNNQVAGVFGDTIEAIQIQPQARVVIGPPGGTGLN